MQPAEDVSQREELESLKAKLLEMQQSYNESQRTVAELRAHNASLQSDKQQAQETLGLEKLKLSEAGKAREIAEEQHKSTLETPPSPRLSKRRRLPNLVGTLPVKLRRINSASEWLPHLKRTLLSPRLSNWRRLPMTE
jgi:septation ring formation regulator EzrA